MHWTDTALVLTVRKHGENSAIVRVFSREHGVFAGVVRGIQSKANRGIIQPGNVVSANWQARLSEHIGTFKCELLEAHAAFIMQDSGKLSALTSACAIIDSALPERHPYPKFYKTFRTFLTILTEGEGWQEAYVKLELELLAESGFGLDLGSCAATGKTENLVYVSPKSGRAVSEEAGRPYHDKMLKLPAFLLPSSVQARNKQFPLPEGGRVREGAFGTTENEKKSLIPYARELRQNLTDAEQKLWHQLRAHRFEGYSFRRQYPIEKAYIADFACLEKKLIIELDGGQHTEQQQYDKKRTEFLEQQGYRVLRFWNNDILGNMQGVLVTILEALECVERAPSLTLPLRGEGMLWPLKGEGMTCKPQKSLPEWN